MFDIFEDPESEFFVQNKFLLIDGSYLMFRSFFGYGVDKFHKHNGEPNNCVYGVSKALLQLVRQESPTHIAIAYDTSRQGHRLDMLPQYKDGRNKTPDELLEQFPPVKELLRLLGITVLEKERYEADDIIATLASSADENKFKVRIFSSDKDMFQLVTENVHIIRPITGGVFEIVDEAKVVEKSGVSPKRYPDLAALVGEGADNSPGVPGIGPKTALKLLQKYGDLDNLLNNISDVEGRIGKLLCEHVEQVRLNRQVNELLRDVPIDYELSDFAVPHTYSDSVDDFLRQWEIPSLVGKFKSIFQ
jgi:DNA polymerase-1